jgi:hypothetical protein
MNLSRKYLSAYETYYLANKIIVFILLLVLLYPLFTKYFNLGFSCQYKMIYGTECRSCGLTRGLESCVKFDFINANKLNAQSTFIFIALICQILLRFLLMLFSRFNFFKTHSNIVRTLSLDLFINTTLIIINLKYYG